MILIDILPNEINKPQCPEFYIHNCRFHWRNIHGRREFILLSIALLFRKEDKDARAGISAADHGILGNEIVKCRVRKKLYVQYYFELGFGLVALTFFTPRRCKIM